MDGNPFPLDKQTLIWIGITIVGVLCFLSFWRRRHNTIHDLKWFAFSLSASWIEFLIFKSYGSVTISAYIVMALTALVIWQRRPYPFGTTIPVTVRRRVIAKWERQTGKKFHRRKHEIDHIIPFSRGGGHTVDNLRVIEKTINRSKGARLPWWDVPGHVRDIISRR